MLRHLGVLIVVCRRESRPDRHAMVVLPFGLVSRDASRVQWVSMLRHLGVLIVVCLAKIVEAFLLSEQPGVPS